QSDWLRQLEQQIRETESRAGEMRQELNQQLRDLGDDWTQERLSAVDVSPEAHGRLLELARKYQDALQLRGRLRRRVRSLTRRSGESLMSLNELLDQLEVPVEEAVEREQARLRELENLGRLRLQEEQLALKIQTVRRVLARVDVHDSVPPWVDRLMTATGWIGAALSLFGIAIFSLGGESLRALGGALSAASFAAAGMLWWCLRNGLQNHFDATTGVRLDDIAAEARQADRQLRGIQERIERMAVAEEREPEPGTSPREWKSSTAEMVDRIGDCSQRIAELEVLQRRQLRVASERMRLKLLKDRFRGSQQALTEVRQEWCRLLDEIGLQETLKIEQAFAWWRRIQDVRELATQCRNLVPEAEGLQRISDAMKRRIEQVGGRLNSVEKFDYSRPVDVLSAWQALLKAHDRDQAERARLLSESEKKSRESQHQQHIAEAAELRREAIFSRAGANDRSALEKLQQAQIRRLQLEEQLQAANEELMDLSTSEPELAITEDDLSRFDPRDGREVVQLRGRELNDVKSSLQESHQKLGRVRQEIEILEAARESQDAFFQRSRLAGQIHQKTEEWLAIQLEQEAVHEIRRQFEQDNISGTLVAASSCLHRMTSGRYHRIWAPLGKDYLCVDDEFGQTCRVEQLSGGTREQLFLSIRFALAQEFHRRGVELPLVMDDLFVNFDLERTEAAVDCLIQVAAEGQQILFFTCHEHVAAMFRKRGSEPLRLPGHRAAYDAMKPEGEESATREQAFISNSDDLLDEPEK
ncbi:MAG: ATP-binding protein, partial [Planctomycetaceae bacterium]